MKRLILFAIAFCTLFGAHAQQFKWVKGGGSTDALSSPSTIQETTLFMCTDPNGNVYTLNRVGNTDIVADTFYAASAGGINNEILITSYNCSGQMRWAKLIANNGYGCYGDGIAADSLGNIYVAGSFDAGGGYLHIGYDTTLGPPSTNYLDHGVIKLDTNGNFKWIRFVGENTWADLLEIGGNNNPLAVDANNNVHYFVWFGSGAHITPTDISISGVYDLTYNTAGSLIDTQRLDLDSDWFLMSAVIDPTTNKVYSVGQNGAGAGGSVTDTFFAAAFDASRHQLWQYFSTGDGAVDDIAIDRAKNLYFSGAGSPFYSGETSFFFNGDSVYAPYDVFGVVMKTDSNGTPKWIKVFGDHTSSGSLLGITMLPDEKVAATGTYAGTLHAYGTSDSLVGGSGWNPYMVYLDSSGSLLGMQAIIGDGFYNEGNCITSDKVGNVFVGGYVSDSIYAGSPPIPAYHSNGGSTDFFVMKYGYDCSCTIAPTASYTDTGTSRTLHFTYTGTTTSIDSVVWSYGDGASDTGLTSVHTYATRDTYHVCVTVYTECGSDMYCSNAIVPLSSLAAPSIAGGSVAVYPNPATDELNISGIQAVTSYRLLNITGVAIQAGTFQLGSNKLSMQQYASGMYILEMTDTTGARTVVRVVKQ
jgi:Secretion system C-terminal sorting domain/Beta-propeller repeat/PKD domain